MQTNDLIPAEVFCANYQVEISFINYLHQFGLIEITSAEDNSYIPHTELSKLEQLARLHYDLDINLEGLDAITHLLDRVKGLQFEITNLKNRLSLYEKV